MDLGLAAPEACEGIEESEGETRSVAFRRRGFRFGETACLEGKLSCEKANCIHSIFWCSKTRAAETRNKTTRPMEFARITFEIDPELSNPRIL